MKQLYLTTILVYFVCTARAQVDSVFDYSAFDKKKAANYFFNLQVGTLAGCHECKLGKEISFSTSTIHGVVINDRLRVGGGVGYDSYFEWQTMPVFGSVSYDLFGKNNRVFTQVNYGWAKGWRTFREREFGYSSSEGGQHFSASFGYRIHYGDIRLALSAGYKIQDVAARYSYYYYSWIARPGDPSATQVNEERLKRVTVMLSIGWK